MLILIPTQRVTIGCIFSTLQVETLVYQLLNLKRCKETSGTPDPEICSATRLRTPDEWGDCLYSEGSGLKNQAQPMSHPPIL